MIGEEIWVNIEGYNNKYQVSNFGRVRSVDQIVKTVNNGGVSYRHSKGKIFKESYNQRGYVRVCLYDRTGDKKKGFSVHRLVGEYFVKNDNPSKYDILNHIDGDKTNNRADNLEWCDQKHNANHAVAIGLTKVGDLSPSSKIKQSDVIKIKMLYHLGFTITDISNEIGVCRSNVHAILKGKIWKHIRLTPVGECSQNMVDLSKRRAGRKIFEVLPDGSTSKQCFTQKQLANHIDVNERTISRNTKEDGSLFIKGKTYIVMKCY